ncbi:MAG: MAPEG family protein [Pseudomonadota bacterium]
MSTELIALFIVSATLLALVSFQGGLVPATHGFRWGLGPRDEPRAPSVLQGRLNRIIANHLEGMAMFVPLILIIELGALSSALTGAGAMIFAAGRIAFAVIYLFGVPVWRSAMWGVAMIGLLMMGFEIAAALI